MSSIPASAGWKDLFEASLAVEPPMGPEALANVPARRGVFLLAAEGDQPVLLLTAANMRAVLSGRLAAPPEGPSRRADLRQTVRGVYWRLADSHFEMDWRFLTAARGVYPRTHGELVGRRPAWFVYVDPAEDLPGFRRSREVASRRGEYFGPFPDGRSAGRFADILTDVFDLCRCERALRRRAGRAACVYREMGRCSAPCEDPAGMADYRRGIERACRLAAGDRRATAETLAERMRLLAGERRYEEAAAVKGKLVRLEELLTEAFRYVGPAGQFRYLLVQSGPTRRKAKAFFVDRGDIAEGGSLDYPLVPEQVAGVLAGMAAFASAERTVGPRQREGIALVSQYLFAAPARQGLAIHFDETLEADAISAAIESAAERLRLRAPKGRA